MEYSIIKDIIAIHQLLNLSYEDLADSLGVHRTTISRIIHGAVSPSKDFLEKFYSFAYDNHIRKIDLNNLKIQFAIDENHHILFHGAKGVIEGNIDLNHSRNKLDVGKGFYLGESYYQSSSYIFIEPNSSIYLFDAHNLKKLNTIEFDVSLDWMIMVCYYRGKLDKYVNSTLVKELLTKLDNIDVFIAPIADNNMYETIDSFARGEITDKQAISALSASNLGKQYVLKSKKACKTIKMVDRLYLCKKEREDIKKNNIDMALLARDKSKLAIEKYRREGKYIEELFND